MSQSLLKLQWTSPFLQTHFRHLMLSGYHSAPSTYWVWL